ncbi:MAG: DUF309 domain-containing protein [Cyanobacteria bacterium]|nr:DUF309 domain-containing protein [Cyanobacteria bacterium CG_2015-16_32_12]NCO77931.1 DUF309 domain-containing protein [Cyanobacteria bacterium CG_2015-22_32_23]NCQ05511.1 DUF309 domain-containing protein [Cyanobacteria bacterium CG_2015-09_32_10]NCQ41508.1 DUF309 domain-containing protein [Cyanobacteria bacterium CG_2015-04_32_10]NCS83935.1 DUF309 domain-containing protein [Cyanobacteria bacterium CG_2015-02_32_10]
MNELLMRGIEEFNQQKFYACHDTLEEIWLDSVEPDKTFYQGILQIAVGCYHLSNSNWRGAVILLGEGSKKLREYEPDYFDIDVSKLLENSYNLLTSLQQINPELVTEFYQQLINNQLENNLSLPYINTSQSV